MRASCRQIINFDKYLKSYVKKCVLPQQDLEGRSFELLIPDTGVHHLVRILRIEDAPAFTIRILPRSQRAYAEQLRDAHHLLTECRVPHAPILDVDYHVQRGRFIAILEQFIAGKSPREIQPDCEQAVAFGQALGRLHGMARRSWGALTGKGKAQETYFRKDLLRRANNRLRFIKRQKECPFALEELKAVSNWFRRQGQELEAPQLFSLRHGKLYPSNIIMDSADNNTLKLIDYGSLAYGCAAEDLQMIRWRTLDGQEELYDAFLAEWRTATLPRVAEETERLGSVFCAYFHLREAAIRFKRSQSRMNHDEFSASNLKQCQQQWRLLLQLLEATS